MSETIFTFPWKKQEHDGAYPTTHKWQQGNNKYEIHATTLNDIDLSILLPHCLETRDKVLKEVHTNAHRAPSLFKVFPWTLSIPLTSVWDQVVNYVMNDDDEETVDSFDACLRQFIAAHATEEDRYELVEQLRHPDKKPREMPVQAQYYMMTTFNGYIPWLPGDAEPLTADQLKRSFHAMMPGAWQDRLIAAGRSINTMTTAEALRYYRQQEAHAFKKQRENEVRNRTRKRPHEDQKPKERNTQKDSKSTSVPSNKKQKGRIDDDAPCPVHPGGNHTWGECRCNAYNKSRQSDYKYNKPSPKDNTKASHPQEKKKDSYANEMSTNTPLEEGMNNNVDCIPVVNMIDLDTFLTSTSTFCSCRSEASLGCQCMKSKELDTFICESFQMTVEDLFANGIENENTSNINQQLFPPDVMRPIGLMLVDTIQSFSSKRPLRVMFDSGSEITLFNSRALPKGANGKKLTRVTLNTAGGWMNSLRSIELNGISLPEFSPTRRYEKPVTAIISQNTGDYDVIMGCDVMVPMGIDVTDHKNLTFNNLQTQRVLRWRLFLEEFGPTIE